MIHVAIISANRPHQVAQMQGALHSMQPTWYVPKGQASIYQNAGAIKIVEVDGEMPMKSLQLNKALDDGFQLGQIVVTLDDDYVWAKRLVIKDEKKKTVPISPQIAIQELVSNLESYPQYYAAGISASILS